MVIHVADRLTELLTLFIHRVLDRRQAGSAAERDNAAEGQVLGREDGSSVVGPQSFQQTGQQTDQQTGQESGKIQILAKPENDGVRVDVLDDGPGIPDPIRERLFEPFISSGKQGGTGLGLAIARGIIEAHGGKISLADSAIGAHFVIQLPYELPHGGADDT